MLDLMHDKERVSGFFSAVCTSGAPDPDIIRVHAGFFKRTSEHA